MIPNDSPALKHLPKRPELVRTHEHLDCSDEDVADLKIALGWSVVLELVPTRIPVEFRGHIFDMF